MHVIVCVAMRSCFGSSTAINERLLNSIELSIVDALVANYKATPATSWGCRSPWTEGSYYDHDSGLQLTGIWFVFRGVVFAGSPKDMRRKHGGMVITILSS